jgi:energy-coupling factor transport system permease protein
MVKNINIGRFVYGESLIHDLSAKAKIILTIILISATISVNNIFALLFIATIATIATFLSNVSYKMFLGNIKTLRTLMIFIIILNILFLHEGKILFKVFGISIYDGALITSVIMIGKLLLIIVFASLLSFTTKPMVVTQGLKDLLRPFRFIIPVEKVAIMISITLRFIPTILDETNKIIKAQSSRGIDFTSKKLSVRSKGIISILIPMFVTAFRKADELAEAMEIRLYRNNIKRTCYNIDKWKIKDTIVVMLIIIFILLIK